MGKDLGLLSSNYKVINYHNSAGKILILIKAKSINKSAKLVLPLSYEEQNFFLVNSVDHLR